MEELDSFSMDAYVNTPVFPTVLIPQNSSQNLAFINLLSLLSVRLVLVQSFTHSLCLSLISLSLSLSHLSLSHTHIGDHLSIDYANHFYHPLRLRQSYLQRVYNFTCSCPLCAFPPPSSDQSFLRDPFRTFSCPHPSCVEGIVTAIYPSPHTTQQQEHIFEGYYIAPDPVMTEEGEGDGEEGDDDFDDDEEDEAETEVMEPQEEGEGEEYQPNVTFQCSSCRWHTSTVEEWNSFVISETHFLDNPPQTISEYLVWKTQNGVTSTQACETSSLPSTLGRIHPSHYLIWRLEDHLTRLSLEDLMEEMSQRYTSDGLGGHSDSEEKKSHRLQSALEETLTLLLEMIARLNSFSNEIIPPLLHEKIIYWDRIGQTAIALADHLTTHHQQHTETPSYPLLLPSSPSLPLLLPQNQHHTKVLEIAQNAFQEAYQLSQLTCGEDCQATQELKILAGSFSFFSISSSLLDSSTFLLFDLLSRSLLLSVRSS
jgi:hypothetical protein